MMRHGIWSFIRSRRIGLDSPRKGDFAIVSPEDGHKPRCIGDAPCKVKKK